jgi:hypothetical protein
LSAANAATQAALMRKRHLVALFIRLDGRRQLGLGAR